MLKHLMKYDLKKILKYLVWFYLISIVLSGISRILNIWNNIQIISIIGSVFQSLTYSAIATVLINTFIHILMRFSTSFFKDQSYLTHTLPVKKDSLILSKFLSSLIVIVFSVLVCFLSLFILFYTPELTKALKTSLDNVVLDFNMSAGVFVFLLILIIFSQVCAIMSMGFTATVKGYSYSNKRGIKGFLWFILFYAVCSIASLTAIVIVSAITGNINNLFTEKMSSANFLTVLIVALIAYSIYAIAFYFYCKKEFKKGVNVD